MAIENILEKTKQAQEAGYSNDEIYTYLRVEGVPASEILKALAPQTTEQEQPTQDQRPFAERHPVLNVAKEIALTPARVAATPLAGLASGLGRPSPALEKFSGVQFSAPLGSPEGRKVPFQLGQRALEAGAFALPVGPAQTFVKQGFTAAGTKGLLGSILQTAGLGGGFGALQAGEAGEPIGPAAKRGAIIGGIAGAALPLAFRGVKNFRTFIGRGLQKTGEKIELSQLRPTKADIEDGFKIQNVTKHGVGGSIRKAEVKVDTRLNELSKELTKTLKSSDAKVDLNVVYQELENGLKAGKPQQFGKVGQVDRVLTQLKDEIALQSKSGQVDLATATQIKRAAGQLGAWQFGAVDPEARARELVYSKFYGILRKKIETAGPPGIQAINKSISELIPIQNAILRRIPVAERASVIGLTDVLSGIGTLATGRLEPLAIAAAARAGRSGTIGSALAGLGSRIVQKQGQRTLSPALINLIRQAVLQSLKRPKQ